MPFCCVRGCYSSSGYGSAKETGLIMYSFPNKPYEGELREKWIQAINRRNPDGSLWRNTKNSRVCNKHFINGKKSNIWSHPASVPSVFLESCSFHHCNNRNIDVGKADIRLFPFPVDPDLKKAWIQVALRTPEEYDRLVATGRTPWICSNHFFPHDFEWKESAKELRPGAVPAIFQVIHHEEPKRKNRRKTLYPFSDVPLKRCSVVISKQEKRLADEHLGESDAIDIKIEESENEAGVSGIHDYDLVEVDDDEATEIHDGGPPSSENSSRDATSSRTATKDPSERVVLSKPTVPLPSNLRRLKSKKLIIREKKPSDTSVAAPNPKRLCRVYPSGLADHDSYTCPPSQEPNKPDDENASASKTSSMPPGGVASSKAPTGSTAPKIALPRPKLTPRKDYTKDDFIERIAELPLPELMVYHPGVRAKLAAYSHQSKLLIQHIHRLEDRLARNSKKLASALRKQSARKLDNLLVIETRPECECSRRASNPPGEPPRENLDDVLCDAATKVVPSAEESQEVVEENERLLKKIVGLNNTMRGKQINRVVVIQSEDLVEQT